MNIKKDFLVEHLNLKKEGSLKELGILILKPDCENKEIIELESFVLENDLELLSEKQVILSFSEIIALYPELFSYSDKDLEFGLEWKKETIRYMSSGQSRCYLFKGEDAIKKLMGFKYLLREKYGKVNHPTSPMSPKDFHEKVIRNLVHVADSVEFQSTLWILFS